MEVLVSPNISKGRLARAARSTRSERYYKLTRLDGRDIWGGRVNYAHAFGTGSTLEHPLLSKPMLGEENDATYFSVATVPSETLGNFIYDSLTLTLPYRLFEVEPIGEVLPIPRFGAHFWRGVKTLKVIQEHPVELVLGPNRDAVRSFFSKLITLSDVELKRLGAVHAPLSEAEYKQLIEVTQLTGTFCLAVYLSNLCRAHALKVAGTTSATVYPTLRDLLVTTAWGIATKGAIPSGYTTALTQAWHKTF